MQGTRLLLLAAVAGLMAACTPTPGADTGAPAAPAPTGGAALAGPEWTIFEINGQPVIPGVRATINFEDGRVFGAGSCNRFMGSFTAGDQFDIKLGQMASTMMACLEPAMEQEGRLLKVLESVTSYSVGADGVLVLSTTDGQSVKARR